MNLGGKAAIPGRRGEVGAGGPAGNRGGLASDGAVVGNCEAPANPGAVGTPDALIDARGIGKNYGPVIAVAELSFQVRRGEILGLLGPNGAGKSTALRILTGFQYPDAGRVFLGGLDVLREGSRARSILGYLPESVPLYAEMSVRGYLEFFARLKALGSIRTEVERVSVLLDLQPVIHRPCGNLSRGYRQRVGLAQALLGDPAILILDEPTSGLDPNQIHDFRSLLRELGRDRAVLLSTHILPEALEICDRVLIMNRGKVVAEGSPAALMEEGKTLLWARFRLRSLPSREEVERFGLEVETTGTAGDWITCHTRRELEPSDRRTLLRLAADEGWEILEWGSGAAGLETLFRRLTVGEEVR